MPKPFSFLSVGRSVPAAGFAYPTAPDGDFVPTDREDAATTPPKSPAGQNEGATANFAALGLGNITTRELAEVRLEVRDEIEQVKNDLFGAAMGVSALRDRMDSFEALACREASEARALELRDGLRRELRDWLRTQIDDAVKEAMAQALEFARRELLASLSSGEFFRLSELPSQPATLAEEPQILSSRPL